jgi:hypothetical protein
MNGVVAYQLYDTREIIDPMAAAPKQPRTAYVDTRPNHHKKVVPVLEDEEEVDLYEEPSIIPKVKARKVGSSEHAARRIA